VAKKGAKRTVDSSRFFVVATGSRSTAVLALPTCIFPIKMCGVIWEHLMEVNAGPCDAAFSASSANVNTVTWNNFAAAAAWPKPLKACSA